MAKVTNGQNVTAHDSATEFVAVKPDTLPKAASGRPAFQYADTVLTAVRNALASAGAIESSKAFGDAKAARKASAYLAGAVERVIAGTSTPRASVRTYQRGTEWHFAIVPAAPSKPRAARKPKDDAKA